MSSVWAKLCLDAGEKGEGRNLVEIISEQLVAERLLDEFWLNQSHCRERKTLYCNAAPRVCNL